MPPTSYLGKLTQQHAKHSVIDMGTIAVGLYWYIQFLLTKNHTVYTFITT